MNTNKLQLTDPVNIIPFVGPSFEKKLKKLEIITVSDLLHHIPNRYLDFSKFTKIKNIKIDEVVSIFGTMTFIKNQPTKSGKLMQLGTLEDETGTINMVWFNQFYLAKMLFPGTKLIISGKASWFNRKLAFFSPQYEKILPAGRQGINTVHTGKIIGVYSQTSGITNKWLKARIKYALDRIKIEEFLNNKLGLLNFEDAIKKIHFPKTFKEAEKAKERLAFNEFYNLLITAKERKRKLLKKRGVALIVDQLTVNNFIDSLPFKLTDSQNKVTKEILSDLEKNISMNRLLQGDVGSGKTVVATVGAFATFLNGYQTIFLAPTQILANQHYQTLNSLFKNYKIRISLITGSSIKKDEGISDIIIGTHALLNRKFEKIGLLIIDEQHKFGVKQINFLQKKNPHTLTMTATPIPRTIAQTLFSDMDLSILDEIPENRPKIKTWLVPNEKRSKAYDWISSQITSHKSQCFIICPLVEESESETLKSVKSVKKEFGNLKLKFKKLKLGLLHGKLKEKDKNKVLDDFKNRKIDILVSTPVVEVGIDVSNATIMLIEAADRFGLAQLHQLRGRVGRGKSESYCLLFTENESEKATQRLTALTKFSSGFELAELDLKLRGAGTKQSGFGNLKIADWSDTKLIKLASEAVNNV